MTIKQHANTSFHIGTLKLKNRLIQAPLAGISCAPFRELFSLYTKPAYAVTEMISAYSVLNAQKIKPRYLAHTEQEAPWCIQLSGHDPKLIHQAIQIAAGYKPNLIDLNCGCPKPKIRMKGSGSALMDTPQTLQAVITAMRDATSLPLTAKIRTAGNTDDERYLEAATIIEACGADAILVHGRHHSEGYDVAANYQQIKKITKRVKIPVIANGDVCDVTSMQRCFDESGATALMIGRASIGKPWLFQNLLDTATEPSSAECLRVFQQHIDRLAELEASEQTALFQARRLLKWYFPNLDKPQLADCYAITDLKRLYNFLAHDPGTSSRA